MAARVAVTGRIVAKDSPLDNLKPREREVLLLVAQGLTARQVADKLKISRRTVEFHVLQIRRTLDLPGRTSLVAFAFRHGLVS
jgi:DNA-binding CsgD family transcriptional regulator